MAKVQFTIEAEINEEQLKNMESSWNNYKPLTINEYFEGMECSFRDGTFEIANWIEKQYNANEGESKCLKNVKIVDVNLR